MSVQNEKSRAYFISNCFRSSADKAPWSPRFSTCHKPVNPAGAIKRSMYSSVVSNSASYRGRGRFPTIDISPFRMLINCGSSSILYFRIKRPTLVIRGSFSNFTKAFFRCVRRFFNNSCSVVIKSSATKSVVSFGNILSVWLFFRGFFPVLI